MLNRIITTVTVTITALVGVTCTASNQEAAANDIKTAESTICDSLKLTECFEIVDYNPNSIEVNDKIYTVEDGLEYHTVVGTLPVTSSEYVTQDWVPYHNSYYEWGSSWVRNQEIGYLHYRGTTQAGGNVYLGKRIIQTTLKYRRAGVVLGTATSNAVYKNRAWQAGSVATVWATDSIDSSASKTQFNYAYYTVNPQVTG